jgi:hypothetical protein
MLNLRGHWRRARIMHDSGFLRGRSSIDSTAPAVVTRAIAVVVLHRIVVDIVNDRGIYVGYGTVVINPIVVPVSAVIAAARVSKSVVDAAIVANMTTPIATVPTINAVVVTPPWGRPKRAYPGSQHPRAGHPVIAVARIAPVAGCPKVIVARRWRLAVIRKRRRRLGSLDRLVVGD